MYPDGDAFECTALSIPDCLDRTVYCAPPQVSIEGATIEVITNPSPYYLGSESKTTVINIVEIYCFDYYCILAPVSATWCAESSNYPGNDIIIASTTSFKECQIKCKETSGCEYVTFFLPEDRCYLKSKRTHAQSMPKGRFLSGPGNCCK